MAELRDYTFLEIEPRWQRAWQTHGVFAARDNDPACRKAYVLDMFPYPSGAGLHVGHPEGYTATDIYCRFLRMNGHNVLHPMGWDAFGLPAEQFALETGTHPRACTARNIARFRQQIEALGFSYDWSREVDTTDPQYFKWTQWIFLQLLKRGLAYQADVPVNWCPALGTVLANEEVINGRSERGDHPVVKKPMRQWMLKITAYAERLLKDLDLLDWSESLKLMQRNWIGRSDGATVRFALADAPGDIEVFTTRPDTLFGATYMVLAPEHAMVDALTTPAQRAAVAAYRARAARKSDLERTDLAKDKSGVDTGAQAINPVNQQRIPVWISDYVLASYGTGAIMCVPGHDQRDWEFARLFGLPIVEVISGGELRNAAHEGDGLLVNSGFLDGLPVAAAKQRMTAWLAEHALGEAKVNYKLRDWLFSRQRYWGEPIPVVHCPQCGTVPVPQDTLPLTLPEVEQYQPSGTGASPLALIDAWVCTPCPVCAAPARRETNTMPQWAGSSWYYLRYLDPHNDACLVAPDKERYWMPVDVYVGGAEHAVLHLLYARFWHKVLYDLGVVSTPEPFMKLINQGMVLGEDGEKMSKSRGNVVNPDDIIGSHGADTLRLYLMFMGPLEMPKPWNMHGVEGVHRFLQKAWRLSQRACLADAQQSVALLRLRHKTVKKVTEDIQHFRFNTAISAMMIFVNEAQDCGATRADLEALTLLLSPFAPHMAEEIWQGMLGQAAFACTQPWPTFDPALVQDETIEMVLQINGKLRARLSMPRDCTQADVRQAAQADGTLDKVLAGRTIVKEIFVPNKLLNLVVTA
ncbi:MAG: leucine--tRNA ligase [bacterium]|nr:leucine--tRNA ligase [bacterium]